MTKRKTMRVVPFVCLAASAGMVAIGSGCGGGADPDTRGERNAATAVVSQAFAESSCKDASFDSSLGGVGTLISPNASYNHPDCTNAYIILDGAQANQTAFAGYAGPLVPPSWGCNGMWVKLRVFRFNGSTYQELPAPPAAFGELSSSGACIRPEAVVNLTASGTYKLVAQAAFATSYQQVSVGVRKTNPVHDISSASSRACTHPNSWFDDNGTMFGGECECGYPIVGVSRSTGLPTSAPAGHMHPLEKLLCRASILVDGVLLGGHGLFLGDDRGDLSTGDWDAGYVKAECGVNAAVVGIAQTSNSTPPFMPSRIGCEHLTTGQAFGSCHTVYPISSDDRWSLTDQDWSFGHYKAQCGDNEVVKGISVFVDDDRSLHGLLCCNIVSIR